VSSARREHPARHCFAGCFRLRLVELSREFESDNTGGMEPSNKKSVQSIGTSTTTIGPSRIGEANIPSDQATGYSLESVMADYIQRRENGSAPDVHVYLRTFPHFADELKSFFRNHQWLGQTAIESLPISIGTMIGSYQVEAELARGGMGVVYRATQQGLQRPVALKLINSGLLASSEERRRFRREAEAAARLQHPGIVSIYEIGDWQGYDFFSMSFVDGPTLQKRIDDGVANHDENAKIIRDIARATAFAHRAGIIHRDLKPENVLMDDGARPVIADFGLAKWQTEGTLLTRTGQVLGTPHYMSPQQACGQADGDLLADIYSLGAMLYALLTGQPPHVGNSVAEVLRSVLQDEPSSPRCLRRDVPLDLENICLKAIHYEPDQRYRTADELADDLDRYLNGERVLAAGSGLLDRVSRELRRDQHQGAFASWGMTLTLLGVVIFVAHLVMNGLLLAGIASQIAYWLPRSLMMLFLAILIYRSRNGAVLPRSAAERPVWSIWIGYVATLAVMNILLMFSGVDQRALIPIASALSGFGFIAMAGHLWGVCSVLGVLFFAGSIVTSQFPLFAPALFGSIWLISLTVLGQRYRS
jgi:eukaryotic-like serine/threonine-protein kinase